MQCYPSHADQSTGMNMLVWWESAHQSAQISVQQVDVVISFENDHTDQQDSKLAYAHSSFWLKGIYIFHGLFVDILERKRSELKIKAL